MASIAIPFLFAIRPFKQHLLILLCVTNVYFFSLRVEWQTSCCVKSKLYVIIYVGCTSPNNPDMSSSLARHSPLFPRLTFMSSPPFFCSPYPSNRERVADVTTFLLAGHDTTGYQISWILIEISRNPSVLLKIRSELDLLIIDNAPFTAQLLSQMKYLTMVIREGMRLWPVLPIGSNRVASRDIQYKEFVIPRGSTLGESPNPIPNSSPIIPNTDHRVRCTNCTALLLSY